MNPHLINGKGMPRIAGIGIIVTKFYAATVIGSREEFSVGIPDASVGRTT